MNHSICSACVDGKSHRIPFPKSRTSRADGILDLVHSDVSGPMQVESMAGSRYFVTFTDDKSRWSEVFCMKKKAEVFSCFQKFQRYVEFQAGRKIWKFRSENGGEYLTNEFAKHLSESGIKHETTVPYMPQKNGVAERLNRPLTDSTRSMLNHSGCGKEFCLKR
jgi:transposase InsO family protein